MPAPRATDPPTREGVTIHRTGLIDIPEKRKSWSEAGYRARYDSDPVVVWERTAAGRLVRARLAGPVSANVWMRVALAKGSEVVVLWGDSDDPAAQRGGNPADVIPAEFRAGGA